MDSVYNLDSSGNGDFEEPAKKRKEKTAQMFGEKKLRHTQPGGGLKGELPLR